MTHARYEILLYYESGRALARRDLCGRRNHISLKPVRSLVFSNFVYRVSAPSSFDRLGNTRCFPHCRDTSREKKKLPSPSVRNYINATSEHRVYNLSHLASISSAAEKGMRAISTENLVITLSLFNIPAARFARGKQNKNTRRKRNSSLSSSLSLFLFRFFTLVSNNNDGKKLNSCTRCRARDTPDTWTAGSRPENVQLHPVYPRAYRERRFGYKLQLAGETSVFSAIRDVMNCDECTFPESGGSPPPLPTAINIYLPATSMTSV